MVTTFALTAYFLTIVGMAAVIVVLSALIGRRTVSDAGLEPYECGVDPVGTPRRRFSIKFFLVAALFVVFDAEVLFLFPVAMTFRDALGGERGFFVFAELMIFVGLLAVGLAYVWRAGALDWEK